MQNVFESSTESGNESETIVAVRLIGTIFNKIDFGPDAEYTEVSA